jgi:hypothetical protein
MPQSSIYPLPSFLAGVITPRQYRHWLECKAHWLFRRDKKRGKPYAKSPSAFFGRQCCTIKGEALYKSLIHLAVVNSGPFDPYPGEKLAWKLIGTWAGEKAVDPQDAPKSFRRTCTLMPTIDHRDPDTLDFEVVSWRVNTCKSYMTPKEFVAFCGRVVKHGKR